MHETMSILEPVCEASGYPIMLNIYRRVLDREPDLAKRMKTFDSFDSANHFANHMTPAISEVAAAYGADTAEPLDAPSVHRIRTSCNDAGMPEMAEIYRMAANQGDSGAALKKLTADNVRHDFASFVEPRIETLCDDIRGEQDAVSLALRDDATAHQERYDAAAATAAAIWKNRHDEIPGPGSPMLDGDDVPYDDYVSDREADRRAGWHYFEG